MVAPRCCSQGVRGRRVGLGLDATGLGLLAACVALAVVTVVGRGRLPFVAAVLIALVERRQPRRAHDPRRAQAVGVIRTTTRVLLPRRTTHSMAMKMRNSTPYLRLEPAVDGLGGGGVADDLGAALDDRARRA